MNGPTCLRGRLLHVRFNGARLGSLSARRQMAGPTDDPADSLADELHRDPQRAGGRVNAEFRSRLVRLTDRLLDPRVGRLVDGEDVVQSVFRSFFARAIPVNSRLDLWHLLATIARRKCVKAARLALSLKRGGGRVGSLPTGGDDSSVSWDVADPTVVPPDAQVVMADLYGELRARLDKIYWQVCDLRLDGHTVPEIATELKVTTRTVERWLAKVRERLSEIEPDYSV
jgi:RNA polymerase sigma-70 factor (ECF subfamily)